jgi:hypothetical protein
MTHFWLQNMLQNCCASYTVKAATIASAGAHQIGHSWFISVHICFLDSDKGFLEFHEDSDSDFAGF